jgi:hypothetical protein
LSASTCSGEDATTGALPLASTYPEPAERRLERVLVR